MKVMHLMSTHAFSGAENVACQIIQCFKNDENWDMVYTSEIGENKKILEDRDIRYLELHKFDYKSVKKAIKDFQPDIIHAHDIRASIMASFFYKKAKIISHIHGNHENMRKLTAKSTLYNWSSNKYAKIIAVSQSIIDNYKFKNRILNKTIVLYNVVNKEEILNKIQLDKKHKEQFDVVYLGRLSYPKNPQRLIKVINQVIEKKQNLKVAIIGDGEYESEIKESIKKYGIENNITMYGYQNNPYKILSKSKLMLMTSRYEGTPMCALEAMCLGIPIVSTPTDGIVDIIENNKTGFISNDDEELASKVLELLTNIEEYQKISNNVIKKCNQVNDIQKYKEEMEHIYEKL